jgi:hypothetical protein
MDEEIHPSNSKIRARNFLLVAYAYLTLIKHGCTFKGKAYKKTCQGANPKTKLKSYIVFFDDRRMASAINLLGEKSIFSV